MKKKIFYRKKRLRAQRGATTLEYALVAVGLAIAIFAIIFTAGDQIKSGDLSFLNGGEATSPSPAIEEGVEPSE